MVVAIKATTQEAPVVTPRATALVVITVHNQEPAAMEATVRTPLLLQAASPHTAVSDTSHYSSGKLVPNTISGRIGYGQSGYGGAGGAAAGGYSNYGGKTMTYAATSPLFRADDPGTC